MPETVLPYSDMLGMAAQTTPSTPPPLSASMQGVIDPVAAAPLSMMQRPVQSPQELEARKSGWAMLAEKLSDPNLLRAFGFAGAAMAQPGGTIGGGFATGLTAFTAGEYASRQQGLEQEKLAMQKAESTAAVEAKQAQTATARAQLPGVEAASRVATATAEDQVNRARIERQTAELALKNAQGESDVATVERAIRARKAEIEKGIPDEARRKAVMAELEAAELKVKEARARISKDEAERKLAETKRGVADKELAAIKDMTPDDLRAFMTKSGKYASTTSAYVQQANLWGQLYDALPADDQHKKGKTREQFVQARLTEKKQSDAIELYVKAVQAGIPADEIEAMGLRTLAIEAAQSRAPAPKPGGPELKTWSTSGAPTGFERKMKADGSWEYRRAQGSTKDFMTGEEVK